MCDEVTAQRRLEELELALKEADAVIYGHWWSHRIDGESWRLEDQARPVQDAIRRHMKRAALNAACLSEDDHECV
jgi:hypothetical protein